MANLTKVAQGSLRPSIFAVYTHADNSTPENLTDAALSGWIKDLATGELRAIAGELTVTDGANGVFRWDFAPADVVDEGAFEVQFSATWNTDPTPGRTLIFDWEVANSIMDDAPPAENVDYQGVVRLLVRSVAPDDPQTGYVGLWATAAGLWLTDDAGTTTGPFSDGAYAAAAEMTTHLAAADPHPQYLTEAEGDAAYADIAHNHNSAYAALGHTHALGDLSDVAATAPTSGDLLTWGGSEWAPAAPAPTYTDEDAQDAIAAALAAGTHVNISVAYDDTANSISLTGAVTYTDENAQDAVAGMMVEGTGIDIAYVDSTPTLTITNTDTGSAAVTTHEAAVDPHPQYLTSTEGDAAYSAIGHNHDSAYISVIGTPTEGNLPTITSGGELANSAYSPSSFAAAAHNHDADYISVIGTPTTGNIPTITSGGELANSAYSPSSFAAASHTHTASAVTDFTEAAQDAAASMLTGATHSGASVSYSDVGNTLAITVTDQGGIAKSLLDAKGDMIAASAADTPAKVTVGADNTILIADAAQTAGVKWGTNAPAWADVTGKPSIYQSTLFLHTASSGVSTYKTLLTTPSALTQTTATASANSGSGEILIAGFASPPMGVSVINGNAWNFQTYAKVDSGTGVSQIVVRVYKRDVGGTETQLFYDTSAEINATTATLYEIQSVQTSFTVNASDRLIIKYYFKTTSGSSRTGTLYFQGTDNYSHVSTPVLFASLTMATDTLWDAKGDLVVGTGADTADRLAVGTDAYVLTADSAQTLGVKWAALPTMYTDENAQDAVAAALAAGTHTGMLVGYSDVFNSISLTNTITQYTDELAQDAAASLIAAGTHSGISFSYNDAGNALSATVTDQGGIAKSLIDAKGDLIVGSADNTAARLAVGVDGYVLKANSAATNGVEWAAASGGGDVATDAIFDAKGDLPVGTGSNTAQKLSVGTNGFVLTAASGETTGLKWSAPTRYITLGRYGTLTATAGSDRLYVPYACTIVDAYASVSTAPTGASIICDIHKGGTTIWTTQGNRPTITATNFTDSSSVPDVTSIAAGDYLTLDVDQIGSSVAGTDLRVVLTVTTP